MISRIISIACVLAALSGLPLWGQAVASATIAGTAIDPNGGLIPNARVTATQTATGMVRTTVTSADGTYVLPNLPVGPYTLEVAANGFSSHVETGIVLQVSNNLTINVKLEVGLVSEHVTVAASAAMVETQQTSVSQVVDQQRMVDLPLNGRQATQLILLSGAATTTPSGDMISTKNYPSSTTMSIAGGQGNGTNYLMDGADNNDPWSSVNLPFPFPDALQEFSVENSSLNARYGVHPGGVVNAVTKSGTNAFHGSLFEFLRNGDANARNFFAASQDTLRRNQFGGTVGGPVRKDKLFFFFGYQGTRT
ncbi:MAG: carboxypeptidase regulatory-like domain-containing protein, partial [Bryobacteraceae bacterium]